MHAVLTLLRCLEGTGVAAAASRCHTPAACCLPQKLRRPMQHDGRPSAACSWRPACVHACLSVLSQLLKGCMGGMGAMRAALRGRWLTTLLQAAWWSSQCSVLMGPACVHLLSWCQRACMTPCIGDHLTHARLQEMTNEPEQHTELSRCRQPLLLTPLPPTTPPAHTSASNYPTAHTPASNNPTCSHLHLINSTYIDLPLQ